MGLLVVGVGCWLLVGVGWITVVPVLICCCFVVLVVLCGCLVVRYSFVLLGGAGGSFWLPGVCRL